VSGSEFPPEVLERLRAVTAKRPRTVIDHLLAHGYITSEELERDYGYAHPPRAIRDVREQGIPIERYPVKNAIGRTIAAYRFADLSQIVAGKLGGRKVAPKAFKVVLLKLYGGRCAICRTPYEERYIQVDHRIPYEVSPEADSGIWNPEEFQPLCGSCNRSKSWSCEHCENWTTIHDPSLCATCYWASPEEYDHVALRQERRLDLVWSGEDTGAYERVKLSAGEQGQEVAQFVKAFLDKNIKRDREE
jgi:hypothetical protein